MNSAFFAAVRNSPFHGTLSQEQVDGINAILAAWDRSGDGDNRKLAYLLATAYHETAQTMQPIYERGSKAYFDKYEPNTKVGKALGNSNIGDGYRFRGRGFVQLTGRFNYRSAGLKMDVDLIADPDKALRPEIAGMALVRGSLEGWFTGRKLGDYIKGATADYVNARRVINGTDKAQMIANYAVAFEKAIVAADKGASKPIEPSKLQPAPKPTPVEPLPQAKPRSGISMGAIIFILFIAAAAAAFFFLTR